MAKELNCIFKNKMITVRLYIYVTIELVNTPIETTFPLISCWMVNEKVRNRWRGIGELYALYLLGTSGQWPIARVLDYIICKNCYQARWCCVLIQVSQDGQFHADTYMHVLGLLFVNTGGAKIAIKHVQS